MKTILTVSDLEAVANEGLKEIEIGADVMVTDLAREAARKLDLKLKRVENKDLEKPSPVVEKTSPPPAAPSPPATIRGAPAAPAGRTTEIDPELIARIKSKVVESLGPDASTQILDKIIHQVVTKLNS